ncbi:MAG: uroporphyrinogen-III C-methyltransferase [Verrucomicrobiota bacterium]
MVNSNFSRVVFVGAGPGAADLITVRGLKLLRAADTVIHDSLPGDALLAEVRSDARLVAVGKRCGQHSMTQDEINTLLAREALSGGLIVRLKGGDPGVFGRLGEEMDHLATLGIPFEVVPGVTAATAAAADACFPLTHRGVAQAVTFLTGHCADGSEPDWKAHVGTGATLCLYMGAKSLPRAAGRILEAGAEASLPVRLLSKVSQPGSSDVLTTLGELADGSLDTSSLPTPLIAVIGAVVAPLRGVGLLARVAARA